MRHMKRSIAAFTVVGLLLAGCGADGTGQKGNDDNNGVKTEQVKAHSYMPASKLYASDTMQNKFTFENKPAMYESGWGLKRISFYKGGKVYRIDTRGAADLIPDEYILEDNNGDRRDSIDYEKLRTTSPQKLYDDIKAHVIKMHKDTDQVMPEDIQFEFLDGTDFMSGLVYKDGKEIGQVFVDHVDSAYATPDEKNIAPLDKLKEDYRTSSDEFLMYVDKSMYKKAEEQGLMDKLPIKGFRPIIATDDPKGEELYTVGYTVDTKPYIVRDDASSIGAFKYHLKFDYDHPEQPLK